MIIKLNNVVLSSYDKNNEEHERVLLKFIGDSKSDYIHDIERRLKVSNLKKNDVFDKGFIVRVKDVFIGYVFISKIVKDDVFLEYSVISDYRGKKLGKLILSEVSEYLLDNYNLKSIMLDIDPSNVPSVMTAVSCGYIVDEEEYIQRNMMGKILYRMDNYNYINKKKK